MIYLRFCFLNNRVNTLTVKQFLIFLIVLFSSGSSMVCSTNFSRKDCVTTVCQPLGSKPSDNVNHTSSVRNKESKPLFHSEIVKNVIVTGPVLIDSRVKQISIFNLQIIVYLKKNSSFVTHRNHLDSEIFNLSPLVNILRI